MAKDKAVDSTVLDGFFTAIANAIRTKLGGSDTYTPAQMPQAIADIPVADDSWALQRIENPAPASAEPFYWPRGLTVIGTRAFYGYPYDEYPTPLVIPEGVTEIHYEAFAFSNVETVTTPSTLVSLRGNPNNAFRQSRVTHVDMSRSQITGLLGVFESCSSLTDILLPTTIEQIGKSAFSGCTHLTEIVAPGNYIGEKAFEYCSALTEITFTGTWNSGSYNRIDAYAFRNCSACLTYDFTAAEAVPALRNVNAFTNIHADAKIIVPDALYNDWAAATNWSSSSIVGHIVKESEA